MFASPRRPSATPATTVRIRRTVGALRVAGVTHTHTHTPRSQHTGVDIGSYDELIVTHVKTVEGLRDYIGADSLAYLSYEGMVAAVEGGDEPGNQQKHCTGCFNGVYPIEHDP